MNTSVSAGYRRFIENCTIYGAINCTDHMISWLPLHVVRKAVEAHRTMLPLRYLLPYAKDSMALYESENASEFCVLRENGSPAIRRSIDSKFNKFTDRIDKQARIDVF